MKIIYHIGETFDINTKAIKGILDGDALNMFIESEKEKIFLNHLRSVELVKNCGGTLVKIKYNDQTIYFSVYRFFIDKGVGFALNNYLKTRKAKKLLEIEMASQNF